MKRATVVSQPTAETIRAVDTWRTKEAEKKARQKAARERLSNIRLYEELTTLQSRVRSEWLNQMRDNEKRFKRKYSLETDPQVKANLLESHKKERNQEWEFYLILVNNQREHLHLLGFNLPLYFPCHLLSPSP